MEHRRTRGSRDAAWAGALNADLLWRTIEIGGITFTVVGPPEWESGATYVELQNHTEMLSLIRPAGVIRRALQLEGEQ